MGKTVTSIVGAGLVIAGTIATGGLGLALIAAGLAVQTAGSLLFQDKMPSGGYREQAERKQMMRSSIASDTVIVGKTICSGLLFFGETKKDSEDVNKTLYLALTLASHKISKIGRIWFNDDLIDNFGDKASYELHNDRTEADPYLLKNSTSWKDDMIGRDLAWLRLTLIYDAEKYPYGIPNTKVEIWGKEIFDPRTNETKWSNNGALVILDYYRSYSEVPDEDIDFEAFKAAADVCDEPVKTAEGSTEPRYTINGAYELEEGSTSILDTMHKCIAAEPTYIAGKHGIMMQAYNGPAALRIEANQIIDTVNITPELPLRDATNAVYGTFVDAEQMYTKTDFTPVVVQEWVDEDGLEIKENMDYRFVSSPYQAERLANLYLRKKRAGRRIQLTMNLDGYAYRPGDVVLFNLPNLGINDVEFRVAEWKFHPLEGVEILLEEDGEYIYEDIIGKPFERPPFTELPTGGVAAPINLQFIPTTIGDVVQGYLSWQNAAADVRYNTINIIEDGKVIQTIQVPGERVDISGLPRGTYRVEVRAVNAAGAISQPAIRDFSIEAPPPPISVDITVGMFSLTVAPKLGDTASYGSTFEFWFSEEKLKDTTENEVINHATKVGQGQFWTQGDLKPGHEYYFYIRTINSYGKSQFVQASGIPDSLPGDILDEIDKKISDSEAIKKLKEGINSSTEAILENAKGLGGNFTYFVRENGKMKAEIIEVRNYVVTETTALAEKLDQVRVTADNSWAAAQNALQAKYDLKKGEASATWTSLVKINYNGIDYDAGMVISAELKNEKVTTMMGFNAQNFAFYNPSNGKMDLFMYLKDGQVFINEAFINEAWINSIVVMNKIQSDNYVPAKSGFLLDAKANKFEMNSSETGGRFTFDGTGLRFYDEKGQARIEIALV
ncbi:DUF1983 domain-containing protein [Arsenophonus sp. aPb]|uniref:phage tail tip protein J-related protein n=1 Tax=Arsenophonus sp. aPb TaxID=3041619 RepID=UPI002468D9C8|nr:DUF1983 domain-containing protein [Arsenophonus sp. aPb]WGL97225.1 DUF1983 domain-containing protein [Arsenophonus sp. aPb]